MNHNEPAANESSGTTETVSLRAYAKLENELKSVESRFEEYDGRLAALSEGNSNAHERIADVEAVNEELRTELAQERQQRRDDIHALARENEQQNERIAELEACFEDEKGGCEAEESTSTALNESKSANEDESKNGKETVADGGAVSANVELRTDDTDNVSLEDIWIEGIPIGTLLDKALRNSKEVSSTTTTDDATDAALTPIERTFENPDESGVRITESVQRAMSIFAHFGEWSSKTPKGRVVKNGLKKLLNTVLGESLSWNQVYRACEMLEKHTNGKIEFKDHSRHGKMLVQKEAFSLTNVVSG